MPTYIREAELTYRRRKAPHDREPAFTAVRSSGDVAPIARALIGSRLTESLIVLALDAKNRVIGYHEFATCSRPQSAVRDNENETLAVRIY